MKNKYDIDLNGITILKHIARTKYSNVYIIKSKSNQITILKQINKTQILSSRNHKAQMLHRERNFFKPTLTLISLHSSLPIKTIFPFISKCLS